MSEPKLTPAILTLLYDLDLLPEQIGGGDTRKQMQMQSVIAHMTTPDQWLPISSAQPKNAETLRLWDEREVIGIWSEKFHRWFADGELVSPTHWQPLSEGPRQP